MASHDGAHVIRQHGSMAAWHITPAWPHMGSLDQQTKPHAAARHILWLTTPMLWAAAQCSSIANSDSGVGTRLMDACRFLAYDSDRVTFRNCSAFGNLAKGADGGGFGLDAGLTNSVIEYCTSYNNWGGGYKIVSRTLLMSTSNNTIRYSSSQGDGNGIKYASVLVSAEPNSTVSGATLYGNTINITDTTFCDYWGNKQQAHFGLWLQGINVTVDW